MTRNTTTRTKPSWRAGSLAAICTTIGLIFAGAPAASAHNTAPDSTPSDSQSAAHTPTEPPAPTLVPAPAPGAVPATTPKPAPAPSPTGWPDADNTGVPAGTTLTPSGALSITTAGTVISGLDITGDVMIDAANVTIRNSKITGKIEVFSGPARFERIEIAGPGTPEASGDKAIGWSDFTCDGCNVYGWGKAFYMNDNVTITNSWVHDLAVSGDPGNGGSHNEAIFTQGGSNFTITNNHLDAGSAPNYSASIALYGQQKPVENVLVQGNLLNGGGYCLYAGEDSGLAPINARYLGNTFGDSVYSACGKFGPVTAYAPGNGNVWSGNVFADGSTVTTG